MIKQKRTGLSSRSEANPFMENGMLPLITAPMFSVVNDDNYKTFLDNKINVCLPRGEAHPGWNTEPGVILAMSLEEFKSKYTFTSTGLQFVETVCIDVANGNMPSLHEAIRNAKKLHGDNLKIMAGNVSSEEAFNELAKTGCDYIRVGIGGSSVCNTTTQTGVGQVNLETLIMLCKNHVELAKHRVKFQDNFNSLENVAKVKIIADGITTYMNQLIDKKQALDNGYAAINRLLYAGADMVMVGRLFAQSMESAGEKRDLSMLGISPIVTGMDKIIPDANVEYGYGYNTYVDYYGMSTKKAQDKYKPGTIKPSEGKSKWIPVKWTLDEWINGIEGDDYLIGYVNALKSAMSYTGSKTLKSLFNAQE